MANGSAVVIGASGGIGRAIADQIEASGQYAVVHRLSRSGTGLDLEDEATIASAAQTVGKGPLPSLIFVATGVLHDGHDPERSLKALSPEHLMRDYRINTVGPAILAKHFLPLMPKDDRAVFAALSARVGSIGDNRMGGWHSYRASKAALNMILKNLAIEMGRTHKQVVVAGLHPGTVDTALSEPFLKGVAQDKLFDAAYSAEKLLTVLNGLMPVNSGGLFAWDGQRVPD